MDETLIGFNRNAVIFDDDDVVCQDILDLAGQTVMNREFMADHRNLTGRVVQLHIDVLRF